MKIAIDVDDVLADFNNHFAQFINTHFGYSVSSQEFFSFRYEESLGCTTKKAYEMVDTFFASPDFAEIAPLIGAVEGVEELKKHHELIVITARQERIAQETLDFLTRHFGVFYSEVVFTGQSREPESRKTKAQACKERGVDYLIEDHFDYAKQCADLGIKVLMIDVPWNQHAKELPPEIRRVTGWQEIVAILNSAQ